MYTYMYVSYICWFLPDRCVTIIIEGPVNDVNDEDIS